MKIEVGKKYNCADGSVVTIDKLEVIDAGSAVFISSNGSCYFWTGHHIGSGFNTNRDLISEYTEDWIPKEGEILWFIGDSYKTYRTYNYKEACELIATGNYYQTEELCQAAAGKKYKRDVITHKLEKLAKRLNEGVKIDWEDGEQEKYCLYYSNICKELEQKSDFLNQTQGTIYCLSKDFKNEAIKEIGKDELESYLKGEYDAR